MPSSIVVDYHHCPWASSFSLRKRGKNTPSENNHEQQKRSHNLNLTFVHFFSPNITNIPTYQHNRLFRPTSESQLHAKRLPNGATSHLPQIRLVSSSHNRRKFAAHPSPAPATGPSGLSLWPRPLHPKRLRFKKLFPVLTGLSYAITDHGNGTIPCLRYRTAQGLGSAALRRTPRPRPWSYRPLLKVWKACSPRAGVPVRARAIPAPRQGACRISSQAHAPALEGRQIHAQLLSVPRHSSVESRRPPSRLASILALGREQARPSCPP